MTRPLIGLLLLGALAACSHKEDAGGAQPSAPTSDVLADAKPDTATPVARRTLAYRHSLELEVAENQVTQVFEAGQAACRAMTAEQCTILNAQSSGASSANGRNRETASATLTMRALPPAIPRLRAAFATRGEIVRQSTSAEELSGPLEDGAKKMALLKNYRDKLEALSARAANDIDSLIKLNRELAEVQGELEAASGAQATLQRRVDTEVLEVTIGSQLRQSFWRPIGDAASTFGSTLSQGTASAITGAAWMLPWVLLLGVFAWVVRKLWRRRK